MSHHSKTALVLAGGGIAGAVYEVGALRAIDEMLVNHTVNDFDIYVGTSAGALINAFVGNGLTPHEIMQVLDNRHPDLHSFATEDVFTLNWEGLVRRWHKWPRTLWNIGRKLLLYNREVALSDLLWEWSAVLPSGIYNGAKIERYVRRMLEVSGHCNCFDQLKKDLYIVATELDSGERAIFSRHAQPPVPISSAVAASSAVPVLYQPVQIHNQDYLDGGLQGAASLDLAIEAGAELVVCINPMTPLNALLQHPSEHYIRDRGFQAIINQSVRTLLHSSIRYHVKNLRVKYPHVDIILIQPQWDDAHMFDQNPMHFSSRVMVAEHGFKTVTEGLLSNFDYFQTVLARHGIGLSRNTVTLAAANPHIADDLFPTKPEPDNNAPKLDSLLAELEQNLQQLGRSLGQPNISGAQ